MANVRLYFINEGLFRILLSWDTYNLCAKRERYNATFSPSLWNIIRFRGAPLSVIVSGKAGATLIILSRRKYLSRSTPNLCSGKGEKGVNIIRTVLFWADQNSILQLLSTFYSSYSNTSLYADFPYKQACILHISKGVLKFKIVNTADFLNSNLYVCNYCCFSKVKYLKVWCVNVIESYGIC